MAIKTLHLTNAWHPTSGGVATFYRALSDEADRRGHELCIVVPGECDLVEHIGQSVRIYHVAAPAARFNSFYRTIYPTQFLFSGSKLQRILSSERPDLIEISDKYTLAYLGGLLRLRLLTGLDFRPVVVGLSNERMDDNFRSYLGWLPLGRQFCSWYMHWIYFPFFDHHIANSDYTAEELRAASRGHMVPRGTWIRHMGADLSNLSPANKSPAGRERLLAVCGAAADSVLLLYVGRLVPEKNLQLLFELTAHLNRTGSGKFFLMVAGDGVERPRWERYAARHLPGHVVFLGHIRDKRMLATLYANADVFVHPNPHEPFGISPLEAMASGLPLVAPDSGGITSYANGDNSWLVPPNTEDFAKAVTEITSRPEAVSKKTQAALAIAQRYRWERVAASFLDLYEHLYRSFPNRPSGMPAVFYSSPATATTSTLASWFAKVAQKIFTAISRLRDVDSSHTGPRTQVDHRR
jgi:alpha-1,6-mannosyltransferase